MDTVGTDDALETSLALTSTPARIVTLANYRAVLEAGGQALGPGPETERIRSRARLGLTQLAARRELVVHIAAMKPSRGG
jgi:NADPH2:quinone reductase